MNTAAEIGWSGDETAHLRRLLDIQPGCLMRADLDGRLLAVNIAAQRLLAAPDLEAALTRTLFDFLAGDDHERWREFARRVVNESAASLECDLTDLAGIRRTLVFQGVALLEHPDGLPSLLLTIHDMTPVRRLEEALAARSREVDTHARVVASMKAESTRLRSLLDDRQEVLQGSPRAIDAPMRRAIDELRAAAGAVASLATSLDRPDAASGEPLPATGGDRIARAS